MNSLAIANLFGYVAAGIGIVTFLPQIIQSWETKNTKAISFLTLSLITTGSTLWIVYGAIMKAIPILFVNTIIFIFSLFMLYLKRKYG